MTRFSREYGAQLNAAQETRKSMRAGDPLYAQPQGNRFITGGNVDFNVPIVQPYERAKAGAPLASLRATTREPSAGSAPIPYERDVLAAVLEALRFHRRVAWAHRFNTGGFTDKNGHRVRFAFKGCSDIIGQMVDGRFLAIEVKRPGKQPTPDQEAFLRRVRDAMGVAFWADCVDDININLGRA